MKSGRFRLQIEFTEKQQADMDEAIERLGLTTRTSFVRAATTLMCALSEHMGKKVTVELLLTGLAKVIIPESDSGKDEPAAQ